MQSSVELYCIVAFVVVPDETANFSVWIDPAAFLKITLLAAALPAELESKVIVPVEVIVPPESPVPEVATEVTPLEVTNLLSFVNSLTLVGILLFKANVPLAFGQSY